MVLISLLSKVVEFDPNLGNSWLKKQISVALKCKVLTKFEADKSPKAYK